jgi:hypothetical protein
MMPGAIFSTGYAGIALNWALASMGCPNTLTTRPSNPFPTGTMQQFSRGAYFVAF